jgi:hypothetical protein
MGLEQAIEAEAQAQAICMQTRISSGPTGPLWQRKSRCSRATEGRAGGQPPEPPA